MLSRDFGLFITASFFGLIFSILALFIGVFSPMILISISCILLPVLCWILSLSTPDYWWKLAISVTLPYYLFTFYCLANIFAENVEYDGMFWEIQFSAISILLYSSVLILSLLAARVGSDPNRRTLSYLGIGIFAMVGINAYSIAAFEPVVKNSQVTFDLINESEMTAQASVQCESIGYVDYWRFRRINTGYFGMMHISILKRNPELHLPQELIWNLDGIDESAGAMPMNTPDGFVATGETNYKTDWSDMANWSSEIPTLKIITAKDVSLTWGKVTERLGDSQFESLRRLVDGCKQ